MRKLTPGQLERTDRVNWSTLKAIGTSPLHYLYAVENPRKDSEALLLGRLTHCAILEPDRLASRYVVSPRFNRAMKDDTAMSKGYDGGREAAAEWDAKVSGLRAEVVGADAMLAAKAMSDAVLADQAAAPLVLAGDKERAIEWRDALTAIPCRGRVDCIGSRLVEVKTTRSIAGFERELVRLGYHAQLAWYHDGLTLAGIRTVEAPCIVVVENAPPYDVRVLEFDDNDLAVGRRVYRACIDRLDECRRTGIWPGVGGGSVERVKLPPWAEPIQDDMTLVVEGKELAL